MLKLFTVGMLGLLFVTNQGADDRFAKWEKDIAGIEKKLKDNPPSAETVFFVGSSTIRMWDLKKSFPNLNTVNAGFGGSQIREATHFAPRTILPFNPRTIIFYSGDNDVNTKRTPAQVIEDFKAFVEVVHKKNPETRIIFLGIKPSIAREKQFETQKQANKLVAEYCSQSPRLVFVDTVPLIMDASGKPRKELFAKDGLHMSPLGYEGWSAEVLKLLKSPGK